MNTVHTSKMIYSSAKKQKLADRIADLKQKEDMIKIAQIIYAENPHMMENSNGLFMFFNKYSTDTYAKIEDYLEQIKLRDSQDSENTATPKYVPQERDDFGPHEGISPKLKLSNKEKNVVKKRRYNDTLVIENKLDTGIVWQKFDVANTSDSEGGSTKSPSKNSSLSPINNKSAKSPKSPKKSKNAVSNFEDFGGTMTNSKKDINKI